MLCSRELERAADRLREIDRVAEGDTSAHLPLTDGCEWTPERDEWYARMDVQ